MKRVALVLALMAIAPSSAYASWSPTTVLSARGDLATYPEIAENAHGDMLAVWAELPPEPGLKYRVMVSTFSLATRVWSQPSTISSTSEFGIFPRVALSPSGSAVVVWQAADSSGRLLPSIQASVLRRWGGRWSTYTTLSPSQQQSLEPDVASDAHGDFTAIWAGQTGSGYLIESSDLNASARRWSKPRTIARSTYSLLAPQIAVSSSGQELSVWKESHATAVFKPGAAPNVVEAASRTRARSWEAWSHVRKLGNEYEPGGEGIASFDVSGPRVAADRGGDALVVWQGQSGGYTDAVGAVWTLRSRTWRHVAVSQGEAALNPVVAMNSRGQYIVAWTGNTSVQGSTGQLRSCCQQLPVTIFANSALTEGVRVAITPSGDVAAAWSTDAQALRAAVKPHDAAWETPSMFGTTDAGPAELEPNAASGFTLIWSQPENATNGTRVELSANGSLGR